MALKIFNYRLENHENIGWKKIFANPMFLQSIDGRIDWAYWNLTPFEKQELSFPEARKTVMMFRKGPPPLITFASSQQKDTKTTTKTLKEDPSPRKLSSTHEESKNNKIMEKAAEISQRHKLKRKNTEIIEKEISGLRRILRHFESNEHGEEDRFIVQGWAVFNLQKLFKERKQVIKSNQHFEAAKKKYEKDRNKFKREKDCEEILRKTEVIPVIFQTIKDFQEVFKEIINFQ